MSTHLSVAEIFRKLEERMKLHQEQADFHARQEALHREQGAFHTAELQKISERFEAFKATALAAAEMAQETSALPELAGEEEDLRDLVGKRFMMSKLVGRVVSRMGEGESFGATRVAEEVNRRYGSHLRRLMGARAVSVTLRRLRDAGRIHAVREGKAALESIYVRAAETAG